MQCCDRVYDGFIGGRQCSRKGKVERNGRWYCGQHDPEAVKARREAQTAKWKSEWAAEAEARRSREAEAAEQKRRAGLYPDLLEALQTLLGPIDGLQANLDAAKKARAAIAKATGEQP